MDDALGWRLRFKRPEQPSQPTNVQATARFGGGDDQEPVLVAVIDGPVEIEMAQAALADAHIPAYIKRNSLGSIYGLSVGAFGRGEVWVVPALAEQARDVLIGIGVVGLDENTAPDDEA